LQERVLADGDQEAELERIAEKIVALAEARKGDRQPYLVSALGIDLGDDLRILKSLTKKGLNEFIQSRLGDRVTLVRLGAHNNVTAIIGGLVDGADLAKAAAAVAEPKPRFHYRFWAAFSVPMQGEVRVLDPDTLTFEDVAHDNVPEDALTVDPQSIAPPDADNRDALIKHNIQTWLEEHSLSEDRFIAAKRLPRAPLAIARTAMGENLLEAMLSALDKRQLQSTSISLDVVQTLLRTPRG
jgi:hypothetical protein